MSKKSDAIFPDKLIFQIDKELRLRINEFRFAHKFLSEASTIRTLLWFALDSIDCGEPAPLPDEDVERVLGKANTKFAG